MISKPTNSKGCARLLLRGLYGEVGDSGRILTPQEYTSLALKLGLSDSEFKAAIRHLKEDLLIRYPNPALESIRLTNEGVQAGDALSIRREDILLSDPLPDSIEGINIELNHLMQERQRNLPKSNDWEWISARIGDLKDKRSMLIQDQSSSTTYVLSGAGSRVNFGVDNSTNSVVISEANLFPTLRSEIEAQLPESEEKKKVLASLQQLEEAKGSPAYMAKFKSFIEVAAGFMKIIGPFIQPLSAYLN
jgi:hypothetical protein